MSREPELYKDKIEVSLDGRQIFYLFFGGAVIVGLVFVLGVMVGRRAEARGHVERANVAAAVDPLAALDRLEGGAGLSFQGSLRGAEPAATEVDKKIADIAKERAPVVEAKKPEAAKPEPVAKKPEPVAAKPEPVAAKPDADKKPDKPKFTLQLSSFQDKSEAEAYVQTVKSAGVSAYIAEGAVDGKQYYRVRVGSYKTVDAANDAKSDIERAVKKPVLATRL